jgi:hypothetical protein
MMHVYHVRARKDGRGFDLISEVLPFGRLWYGEPNAMSNAIGYAKYYSRSHDAVIRVYDEAGQCDRDANWPYRNSLTGYCVFASSAYHFILLHSRIIQLRRQ